MLRVDTSCKYGMDYEKRVICKSVERRKGISEEVKEGREIKLRRSSWSSGIKSVIGSVYIVPNTTPVKGMIRGNINIDELKL